jgi:hypothetical protein
MNLNPAYGLSASAPSASPAPILQVTICLNFHDWNKW